MENVTNEMFEYVNEQLDKIEKENDIEIHKDIICEKNHRFANKPSLLHLERNLFR